MNEFVAFNKIGRLSRAIVVTEKIDGTNAQVFITPEGEMLFGSRTRYITPQDDNYGFAAWATENKEELMKLGPGRHYGEWWGRKIQHGYGGMTERKFSLFNTSIWSDETLRPKCCDVVPVLYTGIFDSTAINGALEKLRTEGSVACRGFMKPEGIIVWHTALNIYAKKTLIKDEEWKGKQEPLVPKGEKWDTAQ
jgi:hypothetical protein